MLCPSTSLSQSLIFTVSLPKHSVQLFIYLFFSLKHSWFKSYGHPIINQKSHKVTGIGCFQKRQQHFSLKWVFLFLSNNHRLKENGFIPFLELVVFHTQKKKKNQDFDIQENGFLFLFLYYIYIHFLVLMFSLGRWMILLKRVSQNQGKEVLNISKIEKDWERNL